MVDDLADEQENPTIALQSLKTWRQQVLAAIAGEATESPILIALVDTVKRRNSPPNPCLIYWMLLSEISCRIVTKCGRSACLLPRQRKSGGAVVLNLAGVTAAKQLAQSDEICTGLQLVNFCQDMSRDAAMNRIYMPSDLYKRFGVTEEIILQRKSTSGLRSALQAWVTESRLHFLRGWSLWENVPKWLARDIHLFAGGGLAICDAIAHNTLMFGHNVQR